MFKTFDENNETIYDYFHFHTTIFSRTKHTCSKRRLSIRFQPGVLGTMLSNGQEYPLFEIEIYYKVNDDHKKAKQHTVCDTPPSVHFRS
jgi:hypothetical protein